MKSIKKILKYIFLLFPLIFLAAAICFKSGCFFSSKSSAYEFITDMKRQSKISPQEMNLFYKDSSSSRAPVGNTLPRYGRPYPFNQVEFDSAENKYKNPLSPSEDVLKRGKNRFEIFCAPCHGFSGRGDGTIITKVEITDKEEGFPAPPDYLRPETRALSDARMFHIISAGQNIMSAAAHKLDPIDRWAIIIYIRELQKNN